MALKIITCPWCGKEARITYEENRLYQMKCYSCQNTMLHVDRSFDRAVEFFEHHAHLLQAEKDGRLRILPKSQDETCGSCGHFKRMPGKRCGTCEVRTNYTDRRGNIEAHRGTFTPSQSRKCCKQYIPRAEAEAALTQKGGGA